MAVCERQLTDANEQIGDLKDRLDQFEDAHDVIKKDFEKVCSEVMPIYIVSIWYA